LARVASALVGDQEKYLAAGMDGYLSKPIRTSELFSLIEKTLGGKPKSEAADMTESLQP